MDDEVVGGPDMRVAVIGMAGRFPGARNAERFWQNLTSGVESVTFFSAEELRSAGVAAELLADPAYVRAKAVIEGAERFDAAFFGYSPREAEIMDPQHRVLLECAWHALEHAGYAPGRLSGPVGVFAGAGTNTYLLFNLQPQRQALEAAGAYQAMLGSDDHFLATRISYKLGLRGPSLTVQTACSSSLVAAHLAVQSLLNGECDMALAGGVRISAPQKAGHLHQAGGIFSPDGHCRPFDAAAQGSIDGDGAGVVVLKRLADALADGDHVHAVILGSAVNNDGSQKIGYTAPSTEGQAEVISLAQGLAGVEPESIGYLEAHGTATPLGDPIELEALRQVFGADGGKSCALGSVKGNIGHLDTAAGVASLIKAALAVEHGQIPPTLHFETPNPQLGLEASPFYVNAETVEWRQAPRRAGVSSFGIGGTNAHVVLEEPPEVPAGTASRPAHLLVLSAATASALETTTAALADRLESDSDLDLADAAYTLQVGRATLAHRRAVVCRDAADAVSSLRSLDPRRVLSRVQEPVHRPVAFLFPGQGAQHPGMGAELSRNEPTFREELDRCAEILGLDLETAVFSGTADGLRQTGLAQPAIFAVEYALARLWMEWGVRPEAMLGHSIGEYVAACLAGVFSLVDALRLVAERGRLMQELPGGAMLAVPLPEPEVRGLLGDGLSLATVNTPALCVVAGDEEEITELAGSLEARGVQARRLHTSHAFHSAAMDPILTRFEAAFSGIGLSEPEIPFVSNLTGTWIRPEEATSPAYWARHLRETVRFSDGLATLFSKADRVLLEVGPGRSLSSLARRHPGKPTGLSVLSSLPAVGAEGSEEETALQALGQLWLAGVEVDWQGFHAHERRLRVALPTYPFEGKRYWIEPRAGSPARRPSEGISGWFWAPLWKQTLPVSRSLPAEPEGAWWIYHDGSSLADRLVERLEAAGLEVQVATPARPVERLAGPAPARIVHLSIAAGDDPGRVRQLGIESLLDLARTLESRDASAPPLHLGILRTEAPAQAMLLGPGAVLPLEIPNLTAQVFTVSPEPGSRREARLADLLLAELAAAPDDPEVSWRGSERWVRTFEPVRLGPPPQSPLREGGTYLITGGLGGVGLEIAEALARTVRAKLVLTGRSSVKEGQARRLRALEAAGAEVLVLQADVTDRDSMRAALEAARQRFGPIHGAIHAAGLPGGGLARLRTPEEVAAVLAPKVEGTLILDELLEKEPELDFLVLCSSLNAILGGPGQLDYAAANAFLGAYAQARSDEGRPVVAIDWDAWRGVGMAAPVQETEEATEAFSHPLLTERAASHFVSRLRADSTWILDEHRLGGHPVVPGTAYLEMAGAAYRGMSGDGLSSYELRDVVFLAPMAVGDGETREVRTALSRNGDGFHFAVRSRTAGEEWQEHALGVVGSVSAGEPARHELANLLAGREETMGEDYREGLRQAGLGPRWETLRKVWVRDEGVVGLLELAPDLAGDVDDFHLHPALLDAATSFAEGYVARNGGGDYLPLSYKRLRVHGPLPSKVYSLATPRTNGHGETLAFDVSIVDEQGVERVRAEEFTLKRVDAARAIRGRAEKVAKEQAAEEGMPPAQAVEALLRIVANPGLPRIAVSVRPLPEEIERARTMTLARLAEEARSEPGHERPDLGTAYVAPRTPTEERLAGVWQDVLGVSRVGVLDDFFELGGHSLLGMQVVSRLREALGVELPIGKLFEAPTVADLAAVVDSMAASTVDAIPRVPRDGDLPVSFAQERLWFLDRLEPGNPHYNVSQTARLDGRLDLDVLARSLREIARRHEILRTAFAPSSIDRAGPPVLRVLPGVDLDLPVVDLSHLGEAAEAEAERLAVRAARTSFDLQSPPLLAVELYRVAPGRHVLALAMHHAVSDGWSIGVFLSELAALYKAFSEGRLSPLPDLPIQYADYAAWQRRSLSGAEMEARLDVWRRRLAGPLPILDLPTDRPRPAAQTFRGASEFLTLPPALAADLKALGQSEGATLFMVLLAGLSLLLGRHAGQDDVLIGSPVAGRDRRELEELIGVFLNTLVLRADLSGGTFRDLLARVREVVLEAWAGQEVPFERLVQELRPERDLARTPLFQALFNMQDFPRRDFELPGLTLTGVPVREVPARFDLTLYAAEVDGGIFLELEHNADLFDRSTAARLLARLATILGAAVAGPEILIRDLPLLPAEERELLQAWSGGEAVFASEPPLHVRFGDQARRTPDAVAVVAGEDRTTYAELHDRARRMAAHLRRLGVGPEVPVALRLERGIDMIVAVLGVLEAGGAYVPLEPALPEERLDFILRDSGAGLVLSNLDGLPEDDGLPPAAVDGSNTAYVIYTSGSTGRPKGVAVTHANVVRLFEATRGWFHFGADDVWTLFHSYAFDFSVWEIWGALLHGGRLVVVPYLDSRNPEAVARLLETERVTVLNQTPSAFYQLLAFEETSGRPVGPDLRWVIFGGEALDAARLAPWIGRHGADRPRLINMYGITETTVHVTYRPVGEEPWNGASAIGRAIPDLGVHVLDRDGRPCPIGVPGELHVSGAGLARGYVGRPELTAERFVPFGQDGGRLYRTGDLARWRVDGELEYLGRIDHQVKIRGFRIELGEIEATLREHPAVRDAVVMAREDRPGDRRLVAYWVPLETVDEDDLRSWLRRRLPDYMLPAAWARLEALPLTATGKVDRRSLPAPEARTVVRESTPPRTGVEERLAAVWQEVLGSGPVGVHDNFFASGGDSILVLQVVARAAREGLRITPRQMFEHQTLAELAAVAIPVREAAADQGPVTGPVLLTPIQRWLFDRGLPDVHHFNQAVLLRSREPLNRAALEGALAAVLEHHDALRLRFTCDERGWSQVCAAPDGEVPLTWLDLSSAGALESAAAALQGSLDLQRGPLLRAAVFDLGEDGSRLLLIAHHLVVDGVSWRVLLEDLADSYLRLARGEAPALPPKTTSYRAWAEWLAESAAREPGAEEAGLRLPVDLPGGGNEERLAETLSVLLEPEETRALLREVATAFGAGVEDLLLAALARTLQPWLGDGPLRVDLEGHGRDEVSEGMDLSRTVGWFTAIRPVRIELRGGAGPLEALRSVKERRPAPSRPAPEVSFNYLGQFDQVLPAGSPFEPAVESVGPVHAPSGVRSHLLEIAAGVRGGRLEVAWTFSQGLHRRATVEALARGFLAELRALIGSQAALLAMPLLEDVYPLSPMQEGLLFHALYDPSSEAYFEQVSCALGPGLDEAAFERAWQRVVDRHPVLRTAFVWEGLERPLQAVQRQARLPWTVVDGAEDFDELLRRDRELGFDLGRAPLMRVTLIREAGGCRFVWSYHHLLLDGWCLPLLLREVFELYEAFRRGEEPALSSPPPYREYIAWLQRQDLSQAESFWRETLAGFRLPTPLGVDRLAGDAERSGDTAERIRSLSVEPLQAAARRRRVTLNALVQASWALLLGTYSGEREVLFGITVSGRPAELPGAESMIGLFINTLPLRVPLPLSSELDGWLRWLLAGQAEAQRFEHAPLARVQEWSDVPRGVALFKSCLVFENYPLDRGLASAGTGVGLSEVRFFDRSHYPLTLYVEPGSELRLRLAYREGRLDAATVQRALGHLEALLEGIAGAGSETRLGDLSMLRGPERHQVLTEWADTEIAFPAAGLLEAFSERVCESPGAPAVACSRETLSYRELDERSNRLARRLRAAGAGRGRIVALLEERGSLFLAAMLAIFKSGAAYLPIDPKLPPLRRDRVLADSGAFLVLSGGEMERLPEGGGELSQAPEAGDLAYVLYTSGSTGAPKGAMLEHRGMVNHLRAKIADLGLGADDVVAQTAPQAFDISVWQFLVALLVGGRVEVFDEETTHDPARFLDRLERSGVTAVEVVPSFLSLLLEEAEARRPDLSRLRWMIPTGEALPPGLCRRWLELYPDLPLLNAYGPTECSDDVTHAEIRRLPEGERVPVGRPVANLRLRVAGPWLDPLPLAVPGEVCVAGEGVGRGYLGDPARTAEAFVPDPFPRQPGERLYRTGDLGRFRPDGRLEVLGRIDHQVKVRGHRIELGDVEAALSRVPGVRHAAAAVREQRLVAYLVGDGLPALGEIREHLLRLLPEAMVPTLFVELPELPLTPNGKVDRRALPAPDTAAPREHQEPVQATERLLARIWSEVLGVEAVGANDDFFELGGDSILSIQIVSRANRAGLRLTPRDLFDHPTVAELAGIVRGGASALANQGPVTGPVPLVPVQRWFFEQNFADVHHWNMALMLELRRPVPPPVLARAVGALLEHHDALRLRYGRGPEGWTQTSAPPGGELPFAVADLSVVDRLPEAIEALAGDVHGSLDLQRGPLMRAVLIHLGPDRPARLLLVVHHLAVDVVSWRILMEDLEAACEAPVFLPPKTLSFQGWAERLLRYAASPEVRDELPYWLEQGSPRAAAVPVDGPGGPNTVASTRIASLRLEPGETRALLQGRYGARTEEVLLAAVAQAVAAWTGTPGARIWLESHGREELFDGVDLTRTVGWFTCEYPVLLEPGGGRPEEAVEAVRGQLRSVPRGGIGYGLLRYSGACPDAARSLAALPQAEVLFNYFGQLDRLFAEGSPFAVANESTGPVLSPRGLRTHLLEVNVAVVEGRLELIVLYSANLHLPETMERLVADVAGRLRAVLGQAGPAASAPVFTRMNLTRQELDDVLAELDEALG